MYLFTVEVFMTVGVAMCVNQDYMDRQIYLGISRLSGLSIDRSNVVYGSRDRRDRINLRISNERTNRTVTEEGNYDRRRTACSHYNIDNIDRYRGLSKEQVDAAIMPILRARHRSASFTSTIIY